MKKIVKFICLLLIAALIAILVLKNGATADTASGENASLSYEGKMEPRATQTVTVTFPSPVTSYNATITTSGGISASPSSVQYGFNGETGTQESFDVSVSAGDSNATGEITISGTLKFADAGEGIGEDSFSVSAEIAVKEPEPVLENIKISINDSQITVNGTTSVSVTPSDVSVEYSSSNSSVASVDGNGTVTGVSAGTATITATSQDRGSASVDVEVIADTPPDVPPTESGAPQLSPSSLSLTVGGDPAQITSDIEISDWTSSDSSVASVTSGDDGKSAVVIPLKAGNCEITATAKDGGKTATAQVIVSDSTPDEPEKKTPVLTPGKTSLSAGGDQTTIKSDIPVTWTSSNKNAVVISENSSDTEAIVISDKAGSSEIKATAKDGGLTAAVTISVKENEQAAPVIGPSSNIKLEVGKSVSVYADQSVTWTSSNDSVATVNGSGLVVAKGVGDARITATNKSGKSSSITVTVSQAQSSGGDENNGDDDEPTETTSEFAISPRKSQTLNIGDSLQIKVTKGAATSWKSSRPAVATVDGNGNVKAIKAGTTVITAVSADGAVAQIKITVRTENGEEPDSDSEANEDVPSTGEASTELLVVLGAITFVIAAFIFRKKTK
ncbi:MAG: Ig-like domain-containing protein [Clostridia bacterium]|nr:Ig-like domain-containing protein [Clostridia bacterium]